MADRSQSNINWWVADEKGDVYRNYDFSGAQLAVLMDIREELRKLNGLLHCPNFIGMPHTLSAIRKNTTKPKRRKAKRRGE
jgi:hypothetical protein